MRILICLFVFVFLQFSNQDSILLAQDSGAQKDTTADQRTDPELRATLERLKAIESPLNRIINRLSVLEKTKQANAADRNFAFASQVHWTNVADTKQDGKPSSPWSPNSWRAKEPNEILPSIDVGMMFDAIERRLNGVGLQSAPRGLEPSVEGFRIIKQ